MPSGPHSLSRRGLLRASGVALGSGVTGCLSDGTPPSSAQTTTTEPTATSTSTTDGETTTAITSQFASQPCPTLQQHADRTVCYHTINHDDPPSVYLEPSTEQLTDWEDELTFTLHNQSDYGISFSDCHPLIYRRRPEGWVIFARNAYTVACSWEIAPGEQFNWRLGAEPNGEQNQVNTSVINWFPNPDETPSGTYAFSTATTPAGEDDTPTIECVALFEIAVESSRTTTRRRTAREEYPSEAVRCRGDPVSVELSRTDEAGYEDNIKYFPSNRTVKFVKTRTGEGPASFGQWSLEEWARIKTAGPMSERVRAVTKDRLGTDAFYVDVDDPPASSDADSRVLWVRAEATETVDGDIVPAPVSLDDLADVAPKTARATASLDGDMIDLTTPVFAQITVGQS